MKTQSTKGNAFIAAYARELKVYQTELPSATETDFITRRALPEAEQYKKNLLAKHYALADPDKIGKPLFPEPLNNPSVLQENVFWLGEVDFYLKFLHKRRAAAGKAEGKRSFISTLDEALKNPGDKEGIYGQLKKSGHVNNLGKWITGAPGSQSDAAKWIKTENENENGTFKRRLTIPEMQAVLKNSFGIERPPAARTFNNSVVLSFK